MTMGFLAAANIACARSKVMTPTWWHFWTLYWAAVAAHALRQALLLSHQSDRRDDWALQLVAASASAAIVIGRLM